jgi:hypothetical protein
MSHSVNSMPASSLIVTVWRKSRHSNPHGDCVELGELGGGEIAVRNSRHPGGPALIFARAEMAAFIQGAAESGFCGRDQSTSPPTYVPVRSSEPPCARLLGVNPQRSQFRGASMNHSEN